MVKDTARFESADYEHLDLACNSPKEALVNARDKSVASLGRPALIAAPLATEYGGPADVSADSVSSTLYWGRGNTR